MTNDDLADVTTTPLFEHCQQCKGFGVVQPNGEPINWQFGNYRKVTCPQCHGNSMQRRTGPEPRVRYGYPGDGEGR